MLCTPKVGVAASATGWTAFESVLHKEKALAVRGAPVVRMKAMANKDAASCFFEFCLIGFDRSVAVQSLSKRLNRAVNNHSIAQG